ncbi:serine hydrolase domain-containing protein [Zobellia laminariae]|uniref:serine hydrolase domain-containing protein n=1 Tax=Zobellia laminariae TaxID=248906 RepID=UPI0026F46327|nr:serine hydrolase [Zobellia laminariae]WKX77068.1 serine hydrolase [Zobellia laminariae]
MKYITSTILSLILVVLTSCSKDKVEPQIETEVQEMYFPAIADTEWETITPAELNWNETEIAALNTYLKNNKTKGFMVLVDGRIVIEEYFNGHNANAQWTWFSAAKSLTATIAGIAQEEGLLNIEDKTSDYLGMNWSSLPTEKEDLITVQHHLSMTTGLTDHVGDYIPWVCTTPNCLDYTADAGTRWAYHQGAFILLQDILTQTTGVGFQSYGKAKLEDRIGMQGNWTKTLGLNIYNSNTRSMARFGLLALNKGTWDDNIIISEDYFNEMTTTSQELNKSYGYLWWLNGKQSYMGTTSQQVVASNLIPDAPSDLFAALGANDQKIYVVPSKSLVVIRSGETAGETQLGLSSFDNELWGKLNAIMN